MPNKGLIYVVFGTRYERLAARAISYSRTMTNLPILVLTNIPQSARSKDWETGIEFRDVSKLKKSNRQIKLMLNKLTPFDETLYLDCDSVLQNKGIEQVFDSMAGCDVVLRVYGDWPVKRKLMSYYSVTFKKCNAELPIRIYYGAFIGFRKTPGTDLFFDAWYKNHETAGIVREMPALAVTVKQLKGKVTFKEFMTVDNIFTWKIDHRAIVAHEYRDSRTWWRDFWKRKNVKWTSEVFI